MGYIIDALMCGIISLAILFGVLFIGIVILLSLQLIFLKIFKINLYKKSIKVIRCINDKLDNYFN